MAAESREQWALRVLSGEDARLSASLLRAALSTIEPAYASLMRARNLAYDRGLKRVHRLPRPTISVGNITTGGTGKTPVVRWLAEQFIARGQRPAILLRGYRATAGRSDTGDAAGHGSGHGSGSGRDSGGGSGHVGGGGGGGGDSDEARMLASLLEGKAAVIANPDRVAGATAAMAHSPPPPDLFLLDDGFQHRRARRDFDLVLINATAPFGHGHVLPRGLLREPLAGLRRASAILITHADQVSADDLLRVEGELARHAPSVPLYRATHAHAALRGPGAAESRSMDELHRAKFFLFAGIGNPQSLRRQLERFGDRFAGFRAFPDHHAYTAADITPLQRDAAAAGAELLVTTEKDWAKIEPLKINGGLPIVRVDLQIHFRGDDADRLFAQVARRLGVR